LVNLEELKKKGIIFSFISCIPNFYGIPPPPATSHSPKLANPRNAEIAVNKAKINENFVPIFKRVYHQSVYSEDFSITNYLKCEK